MKNVLNREGTQWVRSFLHEWSLRGHVQRRNVNSRTIEWKITDRKWLQMYLSVVSPEAPPEYLMTL